MGRRRAMLPALLLLAIAPGCSIAPKTFGQISDPAPLVRARALNFGRALPQSVAVPRLIEQLNDPDRVVGMKANEELKQRTGQDFGYVAWGDNVERQRAIGRWKAWWSSRQPTLPRIISRRRRR